MERRFIYKVFYLFVMIVFTSLFIGANCVASTSPPWIPCYSNDDCDEDRICTKHGECIINPCLDIGCGKGECIIDVDKTYSDRQYYCNCEENTILYQNFCVPTCDGFSQECRDFNIHNREDFAQPHECNTELGHCDFICKGENSCEEGFLCDDYGECRQSCTLDSECGNDEICFEDNMCTKNPCLNHECGNGICNPHKVLIEGTDRKSLCKCNENNVVHSVYDNNLHHNVDICVPICNSLSQECKDFKIYGITECNIKLGHCDQVCEGEGSCENGYECVGRGVCMISCTDNSDCSNDKYCAYGVCLRNMCSETWDVCGAGECIPGPGTNSHNGYDQESGASVSSHCICEENTAYISNKCYPRCQKNEDCNNFAHIPIGLCIENICQSSCQIGNSPIRVCESGYSCSNPFDKKCSKD